MELLVRHYGHVGNRSESNGILGSLLSRGAQLWLSKLNLWFFTKHKQTISSFGLIRVAKQLPE